MKELRLQLFGKPQDLPSTDLLAEFEYLNPKSLDLFFQCIPDGSPHQYTAQQTWETLYFRYKQKCLEKTDDPADFSGTPRKIRGL